MRSMLWSAGVIAVLFAGQAAATAAVQPPLAENASKTTAEDRIEHRVKHDQALRKYDIDVSVKNGVARLTGTVAAEAERERAGRLAKVSGIRRVDNEIVVNGSEGVGTTGKVKGGAESVGRDAKEGATKTSEVMTDGWVTTRVKSRFVGEHLLKNSDIRVDTDDHVVTLKGTVPTAAGRARAVELAKSTEGVHRVIDRLMIGPKR